MPIMIVLEPRVHRVLQSVVEQDAQNVISLRLVQTVEAQLVLQEFCMLLCSVPASTSYNIAPQICAAVRAYCVPRNFEHKLRSNKQAAKPRTVITNCKV